MCWSGIGLHACRSVLRVGVVSSPRAGEVFVLPVLEGGVKLG